MCGLIAARLVCTMSAELDEFIIASLLFFYFSLLPRLLYNKNLVFCVIIFE